LGEESARIGFFEEAFLFQEKVGLKNARIGGRMRLAHNYARQHHTDSRPGATRKHSLELKHVTHNKDHAWAGARRQASQRYDTREVALCLHDDGGDAAWRMRH
ncbi:hypothetical protein HAX54_040625, partial [Datura stramonium]|nr:hypothetical protein [Datura stramonium]